MSGISRGNLRMAFTTLRSSKWRSMLTMLGVIIGIVSVVMVVGVGEGTKNQIAGQLDQFGKDLITVRPGNVKAGEDRTLANTDLLFGLDSLTGLDESDLGVISDSSHVRLAAPLGIVPGSVQAGNRQLEGELVIATNYNLPAALNQTVSYGAFFNAGQSYSNEAVIGSNVAQALFGENVPLGHSFQFRGSTFIVLGVFNQFQTTPLSPDSDFNDAIFIPYQVANRLSSNSVQMYSILAKPDKPSELNEAIASINRNLLKANGGEKDFSVLDQAQNLEATSSVLGLLTTTIAAIAAISLLVGGIGIMNIMLASVTERTREIGIRKAIGATNRQILDQFLLESAVLSVSGGILGVAISLMGVLMLRLYTSLQPVVSWEAIIVATGVSLVIGIIFGVAPAIKAAHKDPIEALRHD